MRITEESWAEAQANELAIWKLTASSGVNVLWELAEVAKLCLFGREHGIDKVDAAIELGVGPLGIGWAALMQIPDAVVVDPLARFELRTDDPAVDALASELQARSTFVQADATQRLDYPDASFDLVVCDNVVDHSQDPSAILREAHRLTRTGGRLLFGVNVFSLLGLAKWRRVFRPTHPRDPNVICHPHSFTEDGVRALLTEAGWQVQTFAGRGVRARVVGRAYLVRAIAAKS